MSKSSNKKGKQGLILIELLVAMAIFAIGITTIFSLFIGATQGVTIGLEKTRGLLLSTEALEAAASISKNDQDYLTPGKYEVGINDNDQWVLIPKTGLMGHFLLANNAQDSTIYKDKNHGILQQVSFFEDRKGQPLAAARFNGNDSYIKTKYAFSLQIEGPLTLSAWVLDTGVEGTRRTIAGKYDLENGGGYRIYKEGDNYYFAISGEGGSDVIPAPSDNLGWWEHIVGVYDPGGPTLRFYVNGKEKVSNGTSVTAINKVPEIQFFIGAEPNDQGEISNFWQGLISDVRVYNRSLTSNEISGLYDSYSALYEKSLVVSDIGKLAGIWSFNEGEGCTVHDNSGNNNHGLIKNCSSSQQWVENREKKAGRAYYFEKEDNLNFIEVADSLTLQIKNEISISLWIKMPESLLNQDMTILHKRATGSEDFSFALTYHGVEKGYGWAVSKGPLDQLNEAISTNTAIPDRWQHIIVTFNDTNKKMYIDNQEIYLEEEEINFDNTGISSYLFIGQNAESQNRLSDVVIDDLRIYNKILDSTERQTNFLNKNNYYLE